MRAVRFHRVGLWGALFLCVIAWSACRKTKRFDGTCADDSDCLASHRCNSGVCVRREPIFNDKGFKVARPESPALKRVKQPYEPPRTAPQNNPAETGDKPVKPSGPPRFVPHQEQHRTTPDGRDRRYMFRIDA